MSIRTMDRVWKTSHQSGGKLLLLLAIADFANDNGMAYPGIDTLAEKTRQSRRTVQRQLVELEADMEIAIEPGTGRSHTNTYWVLSGQDPNTIQKIIEGVKKVKGDKMSPFEKAEKGDISGKKGDIYDTKRVTSDAERVTSTTIKGDTAMTPEPSLTVINRQKENRYQTRDTFQKNTFQKILQHYAIELTPSNKKILSMLQKCRPRASDDQPEVLILQTPELADLAWMQERLEAHLCRMMPGLSANEINEVHFEILEQTS